MTPKQQRFVDEYLVDLNATQAAIRAGYSERTAYSQGQRLLKNVEVAVALREAMEARAKRVRADADQVLAWIQELASSDLGDAVEWGPDGVILKDSAELPPAVRRAVSEVSEGPSGIKIKLHHKTPSLQMLGKHLGLLTDRLDITSNGKSLNLLIQPVRPEAA